MRKISTLFIIMLLSLKALAQPETADDLFKHANNLYQEAKFSSALNFVNRAIAQEAKKHDYYQLRAEIFESLEDLPSALTDYTIITHLQPEITDYWFKKAQLNYKLARYETALTDLHHLLNMPEGPTTAVYFKGKTDALGFAASNMSTIQSDMEAELYNYISMSHLALNNIDSAKTYINLAIEHKPSEADYFANLALVFEAEQDTVAAIRSYQQALARQSDHELALRNISLLATDSDSKKFIEEAYDLAIAQEASYQSYFNRAVLRQSKGEHRKAVQDFDQALALAGNNTEMLILRGYSKEKSAGLEGAIEDYSTALKHNPNHVKAYSNRANAYYKLKRYNEALDDYNTVISLNPEEAKYYYNRGITLYYLGKISRACTDLNKSLDMGFLAAQKPLKKFCKPSY
ncbi:tetratricopeptide repeat protein [Porifericola rhodea]|uniref:tetratricopeptide repeat protein n=1 Tax=Porifericola rhodea TaxID=930972 RepID=UPI002666DADF|nr:tetratricopeptide repeat protein [Porifericola rhodea]WKN31105.1 tetratricopeptide repeat protein [Porifericola rhodea]